MNILVIYHDHCMDGLGAAWACSKTLAKDNNVIYLPYSYYKPFPADSMNNINEVYIVDFSFIYNEMLYTLNRYPDVNFINIDHHASSKELMDLHYQYDNFEFVWNDQNAGCVLTYCYFNEGNDNPIPALLEYLEDRDLWLYKLPYSKAINAYIRTLNLTLDNFDIVEAHIRDSAFFDDFVYEGNKILEEQHKFICSAISDEKVFTIQFGNYIAPCVLLPQPTNGLTSDIIEALYLRWNSNFAVGYSYIENNTKVRFEFRSPKAASGLDVSKLAKQFGGGGHPTSSGTQIEISKLKDLGIILEEKG